jgi:hypothetical protein
MISQCNSVALRPAFIVVVCSVMSLSTVAARAVPQERDASPATIADGTPVHLILLDDLNSKKNKDGDAIRFKVRESVRLGDIEIIPAGSSVFGHVSAVGHSSFAGHSGKLGLAIDYAVAANGTRIPLRGEATLKGGSQGAVTAAATAYWGPPALLIRGWEADIHKGTMLNAYVNGNQTVAVGNTAPGVPQTNITALIGLTVTTWDSGGAQITGVAPNSPAQTAGLQVGYVIHSVDKKKVLTAEDFEVAIASRTAGKPITITYAFRSTALGWMPKETTVTVGIDH